MASKIVPLLRPHEICVWDARLDDLALEDRDTLEILSEDELFRARRFSHELDRKRFSAGRAVLRLILARYLCLRPREIVFRYGRHGKPGLEGTEIRFNMSRSAGRAVYAIARGRETGVDIEQVRNIPRLDRIARRIFTTSEQELFAGCPESIRMGLFFRLWSRKEALAKAMGIGISNQFNTIDLSAESLGSNVLVKAADDPEKGGEWAVFDLAYDDEFAVALAVEWPCVLLPRICPFSLDPDV